MLIKHSNLIQISGCKLILSIGEEVLYLIAYTVLSQIFFSPAWKSFTLLKTALKQPLTYLKLKTISLVINLRCWIYFFSFITDIRVMPYTQKLRSSLSGILRIKSLNHVTVYCGYGYSEVLDLDLLINGLLIRYFSAIGNMRSEEDKGIFILRKPFSTVTAWIFAVFQ